MESPSRPPYTMSELVVEYEGHLLSVVEKPPKDCQAVIKARNDILGAVDLNGLLFNLVTVGKFIRIAYYSVAGDTDLQIATRELGFEISELCDDSGLTINKFGMTADSIVTDLTGAYQFFHDDMEEMVITSIESVGYSAKQMAEAAEELCRRFQNKKEEVLGICRKTALNKSMEEKQMDVESKRQEREQQLAAEEEKKLQKEIESATAEEEKVAEKLASNAADVTMTFGVYPVYHISKAARALAQDRIDCVHRNRVDKVNRQREALKEMEKCAEAITQCSNKEMNVRDQAIPALHGAIRALSNLAIIMHKAADFSKSMQQMCEERKLDALLKISRKYEDSLRVYQSKAVKRRAVKMYVLWVAMETVCDNYIKKIKVSREELYSYLSENPTIEESKARIQLLCRELKERIDKENEKMEKQMKQIEEDKPRLLRD